MAANLSPKYKFLLSIYYDSGDGSLFASVCSC